MAKASAQITLHHVTDIESNSRYYILQSSTASKPSKPTTYPPSSSWSDSEPSYTEGSTNSLYFVDCTVFSDGTFAYSEVSLSSSYEASKIAYNKAQNAQDTANDVKDGLEETNTQLNDSIASVTESYTSMINQTRSEIEQSVQSVTEIANENTTLIQNLQTSVNLTDEQLAIIRETTTTLEDVVNGKIDEATIREWARFDGATLELGVSNSDFKTILSNTELGFYQGTEKVAWISNQELHVLRAIITKSLGVGNLRIIDETETLGVYSFMVI